MGQAEFGPSRRGRLVAARTGSDWQGVVCSGKSRFGIARQARRVREEFDPARQVRSDTARFGLVCSGTAKHGRLGGARQRKVRLVQARQVRRVRARCGMVRQARQVVAWSG